MRTSAYWLSAARLALLAALLVAPVACATGGKMKQLRLGMAEPHVVQIMGHPDGRMSDGPYTALKWANRLMSGWSWDRADYWVLLRNDSVTAYGPGDVRQNGPGVLILIPLRP